MPTIADEFLVRIGLDPTSFKTGAEEVERSFTKTKEVARKSAKEMEESNKLLSATFGKVRNELLAFYGALLGGRALKEFIGDTNEAAASVGRFAHNIGATPAQVVGWEAAVERMGGTAQEADKSLDALSKALFQVHNMGNALPPELYRLQAGFGKIAATKFDAQHGVVPFMNDIAAQAKKLAEIDPQGAFRLLQGAGISDSVANTMIKYGAGMGGFVDSIGKSIGPTREAISAAQDLQDEWAKVRQTIDGLGRDSLPALDHAIKPFLDDVLKVLNYFREGGHIFDRFHLGGPNEKDIEYNRSLGYDKFGAKINPDGSSANFPWRGGATGSPNPNPNAPGGFFHWGAHGAELPHGSLRIHGQELSSSNPLPVDIIRNSILTPGGPGNGNYGDATSFLGGPIGSGGPLPSGPGRSADHGASLGIRLRGSGSVGTWWTADRVQHAVTRLMNEAGLSEAGAAGLVARWAGIEAPGGPASHNNIGGGHSGIGQWDPNRGGPAMLGASFDDQISHAVSELKTTESRAASVLRNARTPKEGARGASIYERAGGYDALTGMDAFTSSTPVGKILAIIHGAKRKTISDLADPTATALGSPDQLNKGFGPGLWTFPALAPYDKIPAATQPGGQLSPERSSLLDYGIPSGGARLSSLAALNPVTTSSSSNSMHVGAINVDARGATDPHSIAREITAALDRSTSTMMAQSGQV